MTDEFVDDFHAKLSERLKMNDDINEKIAATWMYQSQIDWSISRVEEKINQIEKNDDQIIKYLKYVILMLAIGALFNGAFLITRIWA